MELNTKVTSEDISKYRLDSYNIKKQTQWWWVTVNEYDLKHNIHIYIDRHRWGRPRGWQKISPETCLGHYSQLLCDIDFKFNDNELQGDLDEIKEISNNLEYNRLLQTPWTFMANKSSGPYFIIDGVHRIIATFISYFIYKKNNQFKEVKYALCAIPAIEGENFGRFPKHFC